MSERVRAVALFFLVLGACGIGFAPIFVRLSPVGPVATAFWRLALACPILFLWLALPLPRLGGDLPGPKPHPAWLLLPGLLFAGDLAFWHWSIKLTSVANATLLTNCAPVFVTIVAWRYFGERIRPSFLVGMAAGFAGVLLLMRHSLTLRHEAIIGDALGLSTALWYGGYQLAVKRLRRHYSAAFVMGWSSFCSAVTLCIAALAMGEPLLWGAPFLHGAALLLGLALVSQVIGQGAITYALAHLPASFSSVALLVQPFVAAVAAWFFLHEQLSIDQFLGGAIILFGIVLARRGASEPAQPSETL